MLHGAVFADGHHLRGKTVPPLLRRVPVAQALEALQLLQGMYALQADMSYRIL